MPTLNEWKYSALKTATLASGTLNELEILHLTSLGATEGSINERWYAVFGYPTLSWSGAAHQWLTDEGVAEGGSLNERWYTYWRLLAIVAVQITHNAQPVTHNGQIVFKMK